VAQPSLLSEFGTLVEVLTHHAVATPDRAALTYEESMRPPVTLTCAELDRTARAIAIALAIKGRSGDRVLLVFPPGVQFVSAFFGCLYAGMIPVPVYPPEPSRLNRTLPRLQAIATDAQISVVLTTTFIKQLAQAMVAMSPELAAWSWIATDELSIDSASAWNPVARDPNALALLQYTSGSTAAPKGVMVSHANLLDNISDIASRMELHPGSRLVSWLPLYHDMGLIGGVLTPIVVGFPSVVMSPMAFLKSPLRWLQLVSEHRVTVTGCPNFGYDLCSRRIDKAELEGLDFSAWEVAFCGAEPLRPATIERFCALLGDHGFKGTSIYPTYGLAEATLMVSGGKAGTGMSVRTFDKASLERNQAVEAAQTSDSSQDLVACGGPNPGVEIVVVDPDTLAVLADNTIGEICVRGPSVAQGYWRNAEATAETFDVAIAGIRGFLRTGDLGFLSRGELFVTGRKKDLIKLAGLSRYPQDIEATVERGYAAIRPGGLAAFSVDDGDVERLVLVAEVDLRRMAKTPSGQTATAEIDRLLDDVYHSINREHGVHLSTLVLVRAGSIPKTTSGKIQRRATAAARSAGTLDVLAEKTWD
jgi:acyl-CoA synthetase (AMP-forming)/AMP-acid ligase II